MAARRGAGHCDAMAYRIPPHVRHFFVFEVLGRGRAERMVGTSGAGLGGVVARVSEGRRHGPWLGGVAVHALARSGSGAVHLWYWMELC